MGKFLIEPHLHTTYISRCGWMGAEGIISLYRERGYSALCVTDHYNRTCFDYAGINLHAPGSKTEDFLRGYRFLKREAEENGIRVYEGAEVRFDGSENDYLLFGFHHDLLADPEQVMRGGLAAFCRACREDGALLIQAHPYRKNCVPAPAELLDGMEVCNCNPRHENYNELALCYAKEHRLLMLAGSDFHRPGDEGTAGIVAEEVPEDGFEFADMIRSGQYQLAVPEEEMHEVL